MPCHCLNGMKDEDETGIDCGGSCPPCGCSNEVMDGNETDVDCGGDCPPCLDGMSCLVDSDCISGWCYNGVCRTPACDDGIKGPGEEEIDCGGPCLPCHCFDGILNNGEGGVDCGGECPPCRTIRRIINETETGETITYVYNATSICLNNKKDKGETDIDCGGHCPPCEINGSCLNNEDCLTGFCYEGICRISTCTDGIKGPKEEGIDCGGPCRDCPYIKVESKCYLGENLTITVINPWSGLILTIKDPDGKTTEYNVTRTGLRPYEVIQYTPRDAGLHLLELVNYDRRYVNVRKKPLIPILEEIPEEVKSLFVPLILLISFAYWFYFVRRTKIVADAIGIQNLVEEDLIGNYKKIYTIPDIAQKFHFKNIEAVELTDAEIDEAEGLSERYDITIEEAQLLVLCKRLKAKRFLTTLNLIERVGTEFRKTKLKSQGYR